MPQHGIGMQSVTKFAATALGGPKRLRGNFLLADMAQVSRKELWENEFRNVRLVVNCIGHHHTVEYPKDIAATMEVAIVDLRNKDLRHPHFMLALPRVVECLEGGADQRGRKGQRKEQGLSSWQYWWPRKRVGVVSGTLVASKVVVVSQHVSEREYLLR